MIRYLTLIFVTTSICTSALAETVHHSQNGIEVQVTLTPTDIVVGDAVELNILATSPEGTTLTLEDNASFGSFTIVDSHNLLDIPTEQGRSWTWSMQLDTFDATTTSLEGISVNWSKASGQNGSIAIEAIPVTVKSIAGNDLQEMSLRDIKGAVPLFSKNTILPIAFSVVIVSALCWLLYRFIKGNKPTLSAQEQALLAITELKQANLEVQPFYTTLSDIVRDYLEGQFKIAATGQTTREFLNAAKQNPRLEQYDRESLGSFLVAADLVKFARHEPGTTVASDAIQKAEVFIQETAEVAV